MAISCLIIVKFGFLFRSENDENRARVTKKFFPHTGPKVPDSRPAHKRECRPRCEEILYYAPSEEKTWTVHISCKYSSEVRNVGVQRNKKKIHRASSLY